jgi:hypothetical protein
MCPSTEVTEVQREFAADVLRDLLRRIDAENSNEGHHTFLVSHAWTAGSVIYVVFTAPPSDKTWGLVRDTRTSIIGPGPWPDLDEAVSYYYLLDFEENWPGRSRGSLGSPTPSSGPATDSQVFRSIHRIFQKHIGIRRRQTDRLSSPVQDQIGPSATSLAAIRIHYEKYVLSSSHDRQQAPLKTRAAFIVCRGGRASKWEP